jgi:excisionase family DNA binding protein
LCILVHARTLAPTSDIEIRSTTMAVHHDISEEEPTLTRQEAADLAHVDVRTIDRWANEERITRYKVGGLQWVRFKRSEIEAMRTPTPEDPFAGE